MNFNKANCTTLIGTTRVFFTTIFVISLFGCINFASRELKTLYVSEFEKARSRQPLNPVIFIPGVLGSALAEKGDENDEIWGSYLDMLFSNLFSRGFKKLYLDSNNFEVLYGLNGTRWLHYSGTNRIKAISILEEVGFFDNQVIDAFPEIDIYETFLNLLRDDLKYGMISENGLKGEKGKKNEDLFLFKYDWRLDNAKNAINLKKEIIGTRTGVGVLNEGWRKKYIKYVKEDERYKDFLKENPKHLDKVKFTIITHSMGSLIAMYYALKLNGLENIGKLIFIAPPLRGSMLIVKALKYGEDVAFALKFPKRVVMACPSAYQVLPDYDSAVVDDNNETIATNFYNYDNFIDWVGLPKKTDNGKIIIDHSYEKFIKLALEQARHLRNSISLVKFQDAVEGAAVDVLIVRPDCDETLYRARQTDKKFEIPDEMTEYRINEKTKKNKDKNEYQKEESIEEQNRIKTLRSHASGDGRVPAYKLEGLKRSPYISVIFDCGSGHAYVMENSVTIQNTILRYLLPEGYYGKGDKQLYAPVDATIHGVP
jgi:hypothetical protein